MLQTLLQTQTICSNVLIQYLQLCYNYENDIIIMHSWLVALVCCRQERMITHGIVSFEPRLSIPDFV